MKNKIIYFLFIFYLFSIFFLYSVEYEEKRDSYQKFLAVKLNNKWGYIDRESEELVIPLTYDDAHIFSYDLACVKLNGKWGFIDNRGKVIIPIIYDEVYSFEDRITKVKLNGKWGIIDTKGKEVLPCTYNENVLPNLSAITNLCNIYDSYITKNSSGKWGLSFGKDKIATPYIYADMINTLDEEWLIAAKPNRKWGYINVANQVIIPFTYDEAYQFSDGLALVQQNGKWGYINRANKKVIPIKYDDASYFYEGYAYVKLNNKWGSINKAGKTVVPFVYDEVVRYGDDMGEYYHGSNLARVHIGNRWGLINCDGESFTKIEFDKIYFHYGYGDPTYSDGTDMDTSDAFAFASLNGIDGIIDTSYKFHSENEWREMKGQ